MHGDSSTEEYRVLMAQNLKGLRAAKALTQAHMAEAAHVEIQTYQRYEYGDINIPISKAVRMAAALGCTLDELLAPLGTRAAPLAEDLVDQPRPGPLRARRTAGGGLLQRVLKTLRPPPGKPSLK
jgi:transcriptional regulator with XRE-family HTH domain